MKPLLIAVLSLVLCGLGQAADYTQIVAFGDSLSDMGNRWIKTSADLGKMRATWVKQLSGPAF